MVASRALECLGENTVVDLMEALLAPARRQEIDAHAARCPACRKLLSELAKRSSRIASEPSIVPSAPPILAAERVLAPGERVGRYEIREKIGAGAMGAVFRAFDPELHRTVALKLLHPSVSQRERIQGEARAMARLSHPNVVAAYDFGSFGDELFLAMEFVEGTNLRAWLRQEKRGVPAILDLFRQAGAGLAAAHRAGLVHRDVKPENVLVGKDGRARIGDFGLAAGPSGSADLVGTPAYFAPEQFEDGRADAASDQFAFCVSLFEALHGERPFAVNTLDEVERGPVPGRAAVPFAVSTALAKGLSADPAARFASMDELVETLGRDPRRTPKRLAAGGAITAGIAVAAIAGAWWSGSARVCHDSPAAFAAVWNPSRVEAIHTRFALSGVPYADDAFASVSGAMDAFGARWIAERQDSCEATRVRGTQSDQVLTLRMLCLDRGLAEADALAKELEGADAALVEHAAQSVDGLPSLDECGNVAALLAAVPPPAGKDAQAAAAIQSDLARGRALRDARRWADAAAIASAAVSRARGIAHDPTLAAALFLLGETQEGQGDAKGAESSIRDAYSSAETGRDDLLAARAATELVFVVGHQESRFDDGIEWAFHADTALKRAGGDAEIEARLAGDLGSIRYDQGDFTKARDEYQKSLDLRTKTAGPEARVTAQSLFNLSRAVMAQGDNPGALEMNARAVAILGKALGPKHPDVGEGLNGVGTIEFNMGKFDEAMATFDRALAIELPALGPSSPKVGQLQINRGYALQATGKYEEALDAEKKAMDAFDREGGDRTMVAAALSGIGDAQRSLGKLDDALATYRKALAVREAVLGPEHEEVASSLENASDVLQDLGRYPEALAGYRRALAIRKKADGEDYFENAYAWAGIGEALWHQGKAADAVGPLRKAVKLLATYDGDPVTLAHMKFSLAQAIWDAAGNRAEAAKLAADAEKALADGGPEAADSLAEVRAWRASHAASE